MKHEDIDHTGLTGAGGSVATDAIWDAAGDLAVGSGANTAAKLAIGATNGMVLMRVGGAVAWALPSGHVFDYVEATSGVGPTATSEATANTIITANAVSYDGSTAIILEFFSPSVRPAVATDGDITFVLYDGSSSVGKIGYVAASVSHFANVPVYLRYRFTPSNASHTYSVRAFVFTGTASVSGQGAGTGNFVPMYIRQTKA